MSWFANTRLMRNAGLFTLIVGFSTSAWASGEPYFTVTFSSIEQVRRVSQADRVELQILAPSSPGTTNDAGWPAAGVIPSQLTVLRLSYLLWKTSEDHSGSILDSCQQLALLAQNQPDTYDLWIKVQVPSDSQVVVYAQTRPEHQVTVVQTGSGNAPPRSTRSGSAANRADDRPRAVQRLRLQRSFRLVATIGRSSRFDGGDGSVVGSILG